MNCRCVLVMSSYHRMTRHPLTGKWEIAFWMDGYYGHYQYGVQFRDGEVFDPQNVDLPTRDADPLDDIKDLVDRANEENG